MGKLKYVRKICYSCQGKDECIDDFIDDKKVEQKVRWMGITEEEFMDYVKIQKSGVTNMFAVEYFSDCLTREKYIFYEVHYNFSLSQYISL